MLLQLRHHESEAEEHLEKALNGFAPGTPPRADAHFKLGILNGRRGQLDEALFHFYRAQVIKPDNADVAYNPGTTLLRMGRFDEAETNLARALQLKPDYTLA